MFWEEFIHDKPNYNVNNSVDIKRHAMNNLGGTSKAQSCTADVEASLSKIIT